MKRLDDKRDYETVDTTRLETVVLAALADIDALQGQVDALELDAMYEPQLFTSSGTIDMVTFGRHLFVLIDNTSDNVIADIDVGADYELSVKVIGYDGANVCRLRSTSGSIDGAGTVDYVALYDGGRYLCDGTDWWEI